MHKAAVMFQIILIAYLINFSHSNIADDKVQFVFKEFDFKETSKNVSKSLISQKSIIIFL